LGVWDQKRPLDDHTAVHSRVLLNLVSHGPWGPSYDALPATLCFSEDHGHLDRGDGSESQDRSHLLLPLSHGVRSCLSS
jgi:hypothetical protein